MYLSLADFSLAVNDGYTTLPATDQEGLPLRDLIYTHRIGIPVKKARRRGPRNVRSYRPRQATARKAAA